MPVDIGFPEMKQGNALGPAYIRPELREQLATYLLIRDVLSGEQQVKHRRNKYLPIPNVEDRSPENMGRYNAYLARAVWFPATERTLEGFVGTIFMRDPTFKLPAQLAELEADASGDGQSLEQVIRQIVSYNTGFGRGGVLVDYPNTQGEGVTQADVEAGDVRPTIKVYAPWHVVNWRTQIVGAKETLSLVVIFEAYEIDDDGFERKYEMQIRELRMVNGQCQVQTWQRVGQDTGWTVFEGPFIYRDGKGTPLDHIPFSFFGSVSNNSAVDRAPMEGIARLNLAHYRNSADYEESVFLIGQPTPVFGGLTEDWVTNVFKGKVVLGSRSAVPLPAGGTAQLLQAQPNSMAKEAMDAKERNMVALGAKLVQQSDVQRTATETDIESTAENSMLSAIAKNSREVMVWALTEAALFANAGATEFDLSTEFDLAKLDPNERAQLIKEWQSGAIAWPEMRDALRRAGIASLPDDEAAQLIAEEAADAASAAIAIMQAAPPAPGQPGVPPAPAPSDPAAGPNPTKFDKPSPPASGE